MTTPAGFWDKIADRYAKTPIRDEASYEQKLAVTQEYLTPDSVVLEYGCGTGSTALLHAPKVKSILATDVSTRMIEIAREKAEGEGITNVQFEQGTLEDLDRHDDHFDAVLALNVLHLLEDWEAALGRSYRLLKPGGVFITSTPCLSGVMLLLKPVLAVARWTGRVPKVMFFNADTYRAAMKNAGFDIEHEWLPGPRKALFMVARKPV